MAPILKGILKAVVSRKLVEKVGKLPAQPSTAVGSSAVIASMIPAENLVELGVALPVEYDLGIRIITLIVGLYFVITEKK